jgi:S-formylglutathione hydrolase FrmB
LSKCAVYPFSRPRRFAGPSNGPSFGALRLALLIAVTAALPCAAQSYFVACTNRHAPCAAHLDPKCVGGKPSPEIGMTERDAWRSWCMPTRIVKTHTANSTTSIWFYNEGDQRSAIFFDNGFVTALQTQ